MNENLDLVEILKDCPKGTKLYSPLVGEVEFKGIDSNDGNYPIDTQSCFSTKSFAFTKQGSYYIDECGECLLFPSKDQRDWSKFKVPVEKFDYSTLRPFDKVLVRDADRDIWRCNSFTCFDDNQVVCDERWQQGIPYNEETKHLAGTSDMPGAKYIWWEE